MSEKLDHLLSELLKQLETLRLDGLTLYMAGCLYYMYLHRKHDNEFAKGLKGENGLFEAPEQVIYYWLQAFPFILFGDAFLGLVMSDSMTWIFILILFFAIMGRAGLELILGWKGKVADKVISKIENPSPDEQK